MPYLHEWLHVHALARPAHPAMYFLGTAITYGELDAYAFAMSALLAELGLRKGDAIALYMPNMPHFLIAKFGAERLGVAVSPVSPLAKEWEVEYQLQDLGAKLVICDDDRLDIARAACEKLGISHLLSASLFDFSVKSVAAKAESGLPAPGDPLMPRLLDRLGRSAKGSVDGDDTCLIMYTSGSTGMPKGAMLTYANAAYKAEAVVTASRLTEADVVLGVMPLCHIAGLLMGACATVRAGATLVLLPKFDPEVAMDAIQLHRVTVMYTVTPMNLAIMQHPRSGHTDFSSLRLNPCTSFGVPVTDRVAAEWKALTGVPLYEAAYGLTETHTADTQMPLDAIRYGTHGKPIPGTQIRIAPLDDPTGELGPGEEGEIWIRSPGVMKGYLHREEATREALQDGWLRTGDIGLMDDDGYLIFRGRKKEMIKCSGYSVFPEEVEHWLSRHEAIRQVAVIGVPDPQKGEVVKAFVVLEPSYVGRVTEADIIAWSREKIAHYKCPRHVEFRESLPATGTGKILRRALAEEEAAKPK
ncbi:class I adenylate-forming enzyme family protein [Alicyclobacillus acidocaldarius]|uniref:AMP-dependent synthetase and ligase n=1 Tax=Alicyclobacillus acidocaldarius subsp. acidocaldarius (strain ATCC 27009 / DSM 446 / BCRC 14685 / JCM 5260 / KCTC 1825 / NBRC 15652 / NCIMB 11725 / NRRL B-14509 / 104-IA) TaxID=521098 RepID=C8WQA2_ALIAD|nr:AMP-binding protein [Alicyclobacillus acidocaldarius]ACV59047.1 AMP-dependent synthetase and ligase [Alicyclobacillus acidocaldarius subsp. acidocaldarius DSM 446]